MVVRRIVVHIDSIAFPGSGSRLERMRADFSDELSRHLALPRNVARLRTMQSAEHIRSTSDSIRTGDGGDGQRAARSVVRELLK
jgi:hypothetical protein